MLETYIEGQCRVCGAQASQEEPLISIYGDKLCLECACKLYSTEFEEED